MNIVCIKDKLKEGVDLVGRVAGNHPTLAIVKNILIEADKEKIRLTATDLEIAMQCNVPGKVIQPGNITVPAALLGQILSALSEDRVNLTVKGNSLEITTDSYSANVQGTSAEEFPLIPKLEKTEDSIEMEASVLKESLDKTLAAAQFSELRPELNSVFMHFAMDKITLTATDSFRLAEKTLNDSDFTATYDEEFRILIPLKTAQEAIRFLRKDGKVKISRDANQILITTSEVEFISRLVTGTFPDYHAIVPKEFGAEITFVSTEFLAALKLASVFGSAVPEVVLRPADGGKALEIYSRDEKFGDNRALVPAKIKGEFQETNFNWKYLLDGARALDAKEVTLSLSEENRPAMLTSREDSSYFYLVMPILKA